MAEFKNIAEKENVNENEIFDDFIVSATDENGKKVVRTKGKREFAFGLDTVAGGRLFLIESYTNNSDGTCTLTWVAPYTKRNAVYHVYMDTSEGPYEADLEFIEDFTASEIDSIDLSIYPNAFLIYSNSETSYEFCAVISGNIAPFTPTVTLISEAEFTDGRTIQTLYDPGDKSELADDKKCTVVLSDFPDYTYDDVKKCFVSVRADWNRHHIGTIKAFDKVNRTITLSEQVFNTVEDDISEEVLGMERPYEYGASFWIEGCPLAGTCDMDSLEVGEDPVAAFAAGNGCSAHNLASAAFGKNCHAGGRYSFACGKGTYAGYACFVSGNGNKASGNGAFSSGHSCHAKGSNSMAVGYQAKANGEVSAAFNGYTIAENDYETALGRYNKSYTDQNGAKTLFTVGKGTSNSKRANAFAIFDDGHGEINAMGTTDNSIVIKSYVDALITRIETLEAELAALKA